MGTVAGCMCIVYGDCCWLQGYSVWGLLLVAGV